MKYNDPIIENMLIIKKEFEKSLPDNQKNIDDLFVDIVSSLYEFTPKEVAHKYKVHFSLIYKIHQVLENQLSKSNEVTLTLFLKRENFNYQNYDFYDPRDMFYIIKNELLTKSIEEVARLENLPLNIVEKIHCLIFK